MKLLYYPDKSLYTKCEEVVDFIDLPYILDGMRSIMDSNRGLGLSANQVGINKQIFIAKNNKGEVVEFINPKVLLTEGFNSMSEGCLSAPGVFIPVVRADYVVVEASNREGGRFVEEANELYGRCILHELEHLNGEFYFDKVNRNARRAAISQLKRNLK